MLNYTFNLILVLFYNMDYSHLEPEGAGMLLMYHNNTFLVERNPDYIKNDKKKHELEYPGGKIEKGETYKSCAIREVKEETSNMLEIDENQLSEDKSVIIKSPARKGICLFVVNLTPEQFNLMGTISLRLAQNSFEDKIYNETLSIVSVPLVELKNYIKEDRKFLVNDLPLRQFNKFLIMELIKQEKI